MTMKETPSTITIQTNGTCKGNPGLGSWAAIIEDDQKRMCLADRVLHTTSQRIQLLAAVEALSVLAKHAGRPIQLFSNSSYLVEGMNKGVNVWKKRNWKGSDRKPIQNQDLWMRLDVLNRIHAVSWVWVKAHSGHLGNEQADRLANRAIVSGTIRQLFPKQTRSLQDVMHIG